VFKPVFYTLLFWKSPSSENEVHRSIIDNPRTRTESTEEEDEEQTINQNQNTRGQNEKLFGTIQSKNTEQLNLTENYVFDK